MRAALLTLTLVVGGLAFPRPVEANDCNEQVSKCYVNEMTTKSSAKWNFYDCYVAYLECWMKAIKGT